MSKPVRVQRKRTKGWRMPENTVYVGRGSKWGNPFKVGHFCAEASYSGFAKVARVSEKKENYTFMEITPQRACNLFLKFAAGKMPIDELKGKNLACWCRLDQPCHADYLLELANGDQS